jgi:hypothetical protein
MMKTIVIAMCLLWSSAAFADQWHNRNHDGWYSRGYTRSGTYREPAPYDERCAYLWRNNPKVYRQVCIP